MDPVSAVANAVGALAGVFGNIGAGRRYNQGKWGGTIQPTRYQDNTAEIILLGGLVLLIVIIVVIARKK